MGTMSREIDFIESNSLENLLIFIERFTYQSNYNYYSIKSDKFYVNDIQLLPLLSIKVMKRLLYNTAVIYIYKYGNLIKNNLSDSDIEAFKLYEFRKNTLTVTRNGKLVLNVTLSLNRFYNECKKDQSLIELFKKCILIEKRLSIR